MSKNKTHLNKLILLSFLLISSSIFSQEKIISEGDVWKYYDGITPPKENWNKSNKTNENWESGISPLGYGDSAIKTTISFGKDKRNKPLAAYFVKVFEIADPFENILYEILLEKDDGAVVYLNGREIFRKDIPEGKVDHYTKATGLIVSGKIEEILHSVTLTPEDLKVGENIIGVSVHQGRSTSVDLIFSLELIAHKSLDKLPSLLKERSLKNMNFDLKLKELTHKLELEKKETQHQLLTQRYNTIKISLYATLLIILILLITIAFNWNRFRVKLKKISSEKEVLINEGKEKNAEIMSGSLNALNGKQLLKVIKRQLEESLERDDARDMKKSIYSVIKTIDFDSESEDDWEGLKRHFNALHSGYLDKVRTLHPSLTDIELRHCIFIKLHMQTKEIANLLHIDPRSVQASRYRLKKKMGLEEKKDLREYLQKIIVA